MRIYAYLAAAIGSLIVCAACCGAGMRYERNKQLAAQAKRADVAQAETDRRAQASSGAYTSMLDYLRERNQESERAGNEAIERVRFIYRDNPLPAVCVRPDGVQAQIDTARQRANAAISAM